MELGGLAAYVPDIVEVTDCMMFAGLPFEQAVKPLRLDVSIALSVCRHRGDLCSCDAGDEINQRLA